MDWQTLDDMIAGLERAIHKPSSILFAAERHDWRPVFSQAKEIQAAFSAGLRYPSREQRDVAWRRFNDARTLLHERSNEERSRLRDESEQLRDEIIAFVKNLEYERFLDVAFFFDPTSAAEMKVAGERLKEAGHMLSNNKHRMLKEHKDECFERFQEIRRSHDDFWGRYKSASEERREAGARRRADAVDRIQGNIRANQDRLSKAQGAYSKVEANLEANQAKLDGARSSEFADRVRGWIDEDRQKLSDISDSIDRIRGWIREGEDTLRDFEARRAR